MFIGVTNYEGMIAFCIVGETAEEVKKALENTSDYEDFPYNEASEIVIFQTRTEDYVIEDPEDPDEPLHVEPKSHCEEVWKLRMNKEKQPYWAPVIECEPSPFSRPNNPVFGPQDIRDFMVQLPPKEE